MKITYIILTSFFVLVACNHNGINQQSSDFSISSTDSLKKSVEKSTPQNDKLNSLDQALTKDIDFDRIKDTICIDSKASTIMCKLSSLNFQELSSEHIEVLNFDSGLKSTIDGFEFYNNGMRAGFKNQFRYNVNTKKVELISLSEYYYGNMSGEGSGQSSMNLLTGEYIGNWSYFDIAHDTLVEIPTIKTKMNFKRVTLEDFNADVYFDFSEKSESVYNYYKDNMIENR